jgi:hypothetical protein
MQKYPAAVMFTIEAGRRSIQRYPAPGPSRAGIKELDSNFNFIFGTGLTGFIGYFFLGFPDESQEVQFTSGENEYWNSEVDVRYILLWFTDYYFSR